MLVESPMSDQRCPICKSDAYLNPDIVIYISPCFHRLCESCIYRIFSQGQAPCPECGTVLRKINYIAPTFEDIQVERECKIRKMVHKTFSRAPEEFSGTAEYNDYLEEFENLVYELLELKSMLQVKERIRKVQAVGGESMLNPRSKEAAPRAGVLGKKRDLSDSEEEGKVQKVGLLADYFDPDELQELTFRATADITLPSALLRPNEVCGVTKDFILSLCVLSLDNKNI
jgi:CDK-activating kinase assembly factor MAT1